MRPIAQQSFKKQWGKIQKSRSKKKSGETCQ
jgi:hypothetical protein